MSVQERKDWSDDARLTAYALGELEGAELSALLAEIEGDAQAAEIVTELRALGGTLEAEFEAEAQSEGPLELTGTQRTAITQKAAKNPQRSFRMRPVEWLAIAATLAAVAWVGEWSLRAPVNDMLGTTAARHPESPALKGQAHIDKDSTGNPSLRGLSYDAAVLQGIGYMDTEVPEPLGYTSDREQYAHIAESAFVLTSDSPLSTFSIDVDTASYSNVRRILGSGQLPNPDAVRIEELINYFPYSYPNPSSAVPFSVNVEIGSAPWAEAHRLVRIGLKGRETHALERRPSNLVFLLDVSGSMESPSKLPLLKQALQMLVQNLGEQDRVAIVVYAGASGLVLPSTSCDDAVSIQMALEQLSAGGSTNGGQGIELAYEVAQRNFIEGGINRVLLATDGDFNVGVTSDGALVRLIEEKAGGGVFLTVLGFGTGNLQDAKMEQLADKGNGHYAYIDSTLEARKVLVEQMGATLETIAKDVKIQVEFNPALVQAYRLIGYENRVLAAQDFNDDSKDAGEIGAGHTVTALYEVVPVGVTLQVPDVDPLKYQVPARPAGAAYSGELLNLKLRYKSPDGNESKLLEYPITDAGGNFAEMSDDSRFAASVAAFGMLLRDSSYRGSLTWEQVIPWAANSLGDDPGGYRAQFLELVSKAQELAR